jgi:hypothetical protein
MYKGYWLGMLKGNDQQEDEGLSGTNEINKPKLVLFL